MAVGDAGRRGTHRMHYAFFAVYADVRLQTEIPLVALLGLMHLRIAPAGRVLSQAGRMDDGCIDNLAGSDADALVSQMAIDFIQHLPAQIVLFQQMTEAQDRGLVGSRSHAQIDSDEVTQSGRIID